jgi:ribosome-binding factor A
MSSRKHAHRRGARTLNDAPDDGADTYFDAPGVTRREGQLCREVQRTLAAALGALDDPSLLGLTVDTVEPAPDMSRLLVTILPPPGAVDEAALLARLRRLAGFLRAEIAAALQHKRTPELAFRLALLAPEEEP